MDQSDGKVHQQESPSSHHPAFMSKQAMGLVIHAFLSFVICSIDRINLSVAIIPMSKIYGWSSSRQGIIQSIFFAGYMTTNILGGKLADRYGGHTVLAVGVLLWSVFTALIPHFASSFPLLLAVRVLLGAGEGVAMPAMNALIAVAVPSAFRARCVAFIYSGMYAGSILGLLLTPYLIGIVDYSAAFYVYAIGGALWAAIFITTTDDPRTSSGVKDVHPLIPVQDAGLTSSSEPSKYSICANSSVSLLPISHNDAIDKNSGQSSDAFEPTLPELMSHRAVWAIIVAHFCCTWGYFVLLAWLPTYLYSRFDLNIKTSALLSALPWLAMFVFANVGGFTADAMLARGFSVTNVRKTVQAVGFAGPALSLVALTQAQTVSSAVALVACALATSSLSQSGVYANHQDIGPDVAGTLLGISNTFASIPGLIGVWITGVVLDLTDQHWSGVFALAALFYTIGLVIYTTMATAERIW